jgi:2-haloacid dehalogenase
MALYSADTGFKPAQFAPGTMTNSSSGASADAQKTFAASLDFDGFRVITFDCYGTLIDWETGLLCAIRPILRSHDVSLSDVQILQIYGELEPKAQNPYRHYRDVLASIVRNFGHRFGFSVSDAEAQSLPESLKNWLPFPDTNDAIEKLKTKYKLAIISNTDDDLFAATSRHFKIKFDQVITAEQARAYKPSSAPFELALRRLALPREQVLHAGQSVHHDVLPAKLLGLATVLVERRGFGATKPTEGEPDLRVPDLQTLAGLAVA